MTTKHSNISTINQERRERGNLKTLELNMGARFNMLVFVSLVVAAMLNGSSAQTTYVVGDALGWLVPPGGEIVYRTWASDKTFYVGDVLVFNFTQGQHDVAVVSKEAYDSCNISNPISSSSTSPTNITLTSVGEIHFLCTFTRHCDLGQKLAINVSAAPAPTPTPTPAAPAPAPASTGGMTYTVGDGLGWNVPPGGPIAYETWARGKTFLVGDILVFNFTNGAHDVLQVTKAEFDSCNVTTTTTNPITTSPARITLNSAGGHYYICTFSQHCFLGQKLAINVTGSGGAAPAPAPSTPAPTPSPAATPPASTPAPTPSSGGPSPSTPSTPSPVSPPPPPATPSPVATPPPPPTGAAPSVAAAALPVTFLAVALAFLY